MQTTPLLVDKWCQLKILVIHEFEQNHFVFEKAKFMLREQISSSYNKVNDATSFFDVLESNFQRNYVVEFIYNLTDDLQLYTRDGTVRLAECIQNYQEDTVKKRRHAWNQAFLPDDNFVGRETDIDKIISLLCCPVESTIAGVSICGPGGMGKTSLAEEICYRLYETNMWTVGKVDLREKERIVDLLWDMLRSLGKSGHGDDVVSLKRQIFEALRQVDRQTLLLLDNIEGVLWSECQALTEFLGEIADLLTREKNTSKVRILLTTREKIVKPSNTGVLCDRYVEHELKPLTDLQARDLLEKSIKPHVVSVCDAANITMLCGNTPLAITMIAGTLRYLGSDTPPTDVIESLQAGHESDSISEILEKCFHKTFSTLHNEYKKKLIRLAVFHTAPFDIISAMNVLSDNEDYEKGVNRVKNELLYLKCRHLIETDSLPEILYDGWNKKKGDSEKIVADNTMIRFSLHPLVFKYLRGKCSMKEYISDFQKSQVEFQVHFTKKLHVLGETHNRDPISTVKLIEENRTHFANFYDTLVQMDISSQISDRSYDGPLTNADKFWQMKYLPEIADIVLYSEKKIKVFNGIAKRCKESGNLAQSFFWSIESVKEYVSADDLDVARRVIARVDSELERARSQIRQDVYDYLYASLVGVRGLYYWHSEKTTDNLKSSLEVLQKSMILFENCQPNDVFASEKAEIVNLIGCVYYKMDDFEKAAEFHQKACTIILDEIKPKDGIHFKLSVYLANIGCIWHLRGNRANEESAAPYLEKALEFYNQAIQLDRTVNIHTRERHSDKLRNRADVYYGLDRFPDALNDAKRALELRKCHFAGRPNTKITSSLNQVGYILNQMGKSATTEDDAVEYFKEAEKFYDETRKQVAIGGYHEPDNDYEVYKEEYFDLLERRGEHRKRTKVKRFFEKYEAGLYNKVIRKKSQIDEESTGEESSSSEETTSDDNSLDWQIGQEHFAERTDTVNASDPSNSQENTDETNISHNLRQFSDEPPAKRSKFS